MRGHLPKIYRRLPVLPLKKHYVTRNIDIRIAQKRIKSDSWGETLPGRPEPSYPNFGNKEAP